MEKTFENWDGLSKLIPLASRVMWQLEMRNPSWRHETKLVLRQILGNELYEKEVQKKSKRVRKKRRSALS